MSSRTARLVAIVAALTLGLGAIGIVALAVNANATPAKRATVLAGGPAKVSLVPPTVTGLNATLTDFAGVPVPDAKITFTTQDGTPMCSARTNRDGYATCDDTGSVASIAGLGSGYKAEFAGNKSFLPSTGFGNIQPL